MVMGFTRQLLKKGAGKLTFTGTMPEGCFVLQIPKGHIHHFFQTGHLTIHDGILQPIVYPEINYLTEQEKQALLRFDRFITKLSNYPVYHQLAKDLYNLVKIEGRNINLKSLSKTQEFLELMIRLEFDKTHKEYDPALQAYVDYALSLRIEGVMEIIASIMLFIAGLTVIFAALLTLPLGILTFPVEDVLLTFFVLPLCIGLAMLISNVGGFGINKGNNNYHIGKIMDEISCANQQSEVITSDTLYPVTIIG